MKNIKIWHFLIILIYLNGCDNIFNQKLSFEFIDFSQCNYHFNLDTLYSIRIDSDGKFIIRYDTIQEKIANNGTESIVYLDFDELKRVYFYGILSKEEIFTINKEYKKIQNLNCNKKDLDFGIYDGGHFNKIVIQDEEKRLISEGWNNSDPDEFIQFKKTIFNILKKNMTIRKDTVFIFESLLNFIPGYDNYQRMSKIDTVSITPIFEDSIPMYVEEMPEFIGGKDSLFKYIEERIYYPEKLKNEEISGKLFVGFIVDTKGQVKNVEVLRGLDPILDSIAVKVISNLPKWKPGKNNGKYASVRMVIPVKFELN